MQTTTSISPIGQAISSVSLSDLDLPFAASCVMDYHEPAIIELGDRIIVGYISDDSDCENPLESCDGMGKIYTAHRHSSGHAEMQEALALDSDWQPNLELVDEHIAALRKPWIDAAVSSTEFIEWANILAGPRARRDDAYYRRRAEKLWRETNGESVYGTEDIYDFAFTEDVRLELWKELRANGQIGDKDVVVLDCYEHGGQSWSLSGQGMQCQFDTASGAGVWVPEECAREEVDRRAKVYTFGQVKELPKKDGKNQYVAKLDGLYRGESSTPFEHWHEAFAWLEAKAEKLQLSPRKVDQSIQLQVGRRRASRELASGVLETYNDWLAGNCYGVVAATFCNIGTKEEPEWEFVESDECWGYIGDDWAIEEAKESAKSVADGYSIKAA